MVMRDTDWVNKLRLGPAQAQALTSTISADADFLRSQGIMDYSLLLGIHKSKYRLVEGDAMGGDGGGDSPVSSQPPAAAAASSRSAQSLDLRSPAAITVVLESPAGAAPVSFVSQQTPTPAARPSMNPQSAWGINWRDESPASAGGALSPARLFGATGAAASPAFAVGSMVNEEEGRVGGVYQEDADVGTVAITTAAAAAATPVAGGSVFTRHRGGLRAAVVEGPGIYYMGIIDVLQTWTPAKRVENFVKTRMLCRAIGGVSAIPPDEYAQRFKTRVLGQLIE